MGFVRAHIWLTILLQPLRSYSYVFLFAVYKALLRAFSNKLDVRGFILGESWQFLRAGLLFISEPYSLRPVVIGAVDFVFCGDFIFVTCRNLLANVGILLGHRDSLVHKEFALGSSYSLNTIVPLPLFEILIWSRYLLFGFNDFIYRCFSGFFIVAHFA